MLDLCTAHFNARYYYYRATRRAHFLKSYYLLINFIYAVFFQIRRYLLVTQSSLCRKYVERRINEKLHTRAVYFYMRPSSLPISFMRKDFSNINLRGVSFRFQDLSHARFSGSDLRGADFTGANLLGADLTQVRTGIAPFKLVWIFLAALAMSAISGYVAMLAGQTIQTMFRSPDYHVRQAGVACFLVILLFMGFSMWKGVDDAFNFMVLPVIVVALLTGLFSVFSGAGTMMGAIYITLCILLVVVMFVIGTVARTAAGSLSGFLFVIVALSGTIIGRSFGGGVGTVLMAVCCIVISRRALRGDEGFSKLLWVSELITRQFGTSFRDARLTAVNFSGNIIRNCDFSDAEISLVHWGTSKKINCITDHPI